MADRLLTVAEARDRLGAISRSYFYLLVARYSLPVVKLGSRTLIRESELERFIAGLPQNAIGRAA
jgi:excisionase family DNA binding protein